MLKHHVGQAEIGLWSLDEMFGSGAVAIPDDDAHFSLRELEVCYIHIYTISLFVVLSSFILKKFQ